jgi:subtilisin family serine protease
MVVLGLILFVEPTRAEDVLEQAEALALVQTQQIMETQSRGEPQLSIASSKIVHPDDLDVTTYNVKVLDSVKGQIYQYWYDANLQTITEAEAFEMRASAYEEKYGHLSRGLFAMINSLDRDTVEMIPVAIWVEETGTGEVTPPSGPINLYLPLVKCDSCLAPMDWVVDYIEGKGYSPEYVSIEAPVIYASLPASTILDLQSSSYVAAIYEQVEGELTMESAARTAAAPWTWERGITGDGVRVAVLENDGVAFDNPYISGDDYYLDWSKRIGSHATYVAGIIGGSHSSQRGIAYDAEIISANARNLRDWSVVAATDWAIRKDVDIINASYGASCDGTQINSIDKYFDWVVWNKRTTVVIAAGNVRSKCSFIHNVSSPGKAYNVITVGAKDDMNTATSTADVSDDQMSEFSCYVDPETASENRLKPEVVATGERIISTTMSSPWISTSEGAGTSYSAPIVAGEAALMMERAPWLKYSPEAVKAGIMATARWTYLHDYPNYGQYASVDKMGVGAVDTTAADNSLINGRIQELYLSEDDFSNGYYEIPFTVTVPERIRVVISWSSHPSRVILDWILHDRLESDFDLSVISPSNQIYGSYADEANYEIVEFVAQETGTYRARINLSRWDNARMEEKIGFAWYSGITISP